MKNLKSNFLVDIFKKIISNGKNMANDGGIVRNKNNEVLKIKLSKI